MTYRQKSKLISVAPVVRISASVIAVSLLSLGIGGCGNPSEGQANTPQAIAV